MLLPYWFNDILVAKSLPQPRGGSILVNMLESDIDIVVAITGR